MIITCEACNTSFNLDDKMLKPTGSKVRCSVCANVFTAFPQQTAAPEPKAPSVDPQPASETQADPEPDLAAAAEPDAPAAEDAGEPPAPETDILEEDGSDLFADGTDLDFALDDEPEDPVAAAEIEDAVSDALEEDLADMPAETESDIADESDATIIASLDDDDFNLDLSPGQGDEDAAATVIASLDDDLDLPLDGQPDVADLDQEDFDLDFPVEMDGDPEGTATVIANLDDETFDLDGDFSTESEDTDASEAPVVDAGPETMSDLDGLNLTLDIDPVEETAQADTADESPDPSLDVDLEPDVAPDEAVSADEVTQAPDEELDLDLEMDADGQVAAEPKAEKPVLEDDLDLSSLESLLDDDDEAEEDNVTMVVDDTEDLELSLDMDAEMPATDSDAAHEPGEALEDLEFDLDGEGPSGDTDLSDDDGADQEIDLSEIEKMLEDPEQDSAAFSSVPDQDLDLDIEASLETEKWMSDSADEEQVVKDEELDLSELEQALDDVDLDAVDDTPEDGELELDLGEGDPLGTPTETVAVDNELDFDLSDFEDAPTAPSGAQAEADGRESVDMELEFEVEEGGTAGQTLEDEGLAETVAIAEPVPARADAAPPEPAAPAAAAPTPKPAKKGVSKSLVFLLIIVLLGGGGYGTYYLLNQNGIEIPFLSDYLKTKVNDPGNLKLTTYDINSKFVDNASVGKLFVISGKVKNGYAENRGMVTLAGKIFSTGKVPANQEKVYCGNIMSDLELANLEWDKIKTRLSNRLGDNRSNVKIEPGKSIPFMVVFTNLPEDLEEFTIEVTGSTSLK